MLPCAVNVSCRSGITDVIFPQGNKREYEEVPDDLKHGMTPHFVDSYEQVFALAFPNIGLQALREAASGASRHSSGDTAAATDGSSSGSGRS